MFQEEGVCILGEGRWKVKTMGFLTSVDPEMYRTRCLQRLWAGNQPWLQLAGAEPKGQQHQNPTLFFFWKHKSFSLPVDEITGWHAKPIKYVFCKFWNEEKCYVKIFTDAEWL